MHSRIFLIGFMGSGKTTLGKQLARQLNYAFVDMDALIVETAGISIPEIFREHGEVIFRKWERDILLELCGRERIVISTGGGAPCHDDMIAIMNENGASVYLELPPSALADRLKKSPTPRPLIQGKSETELLEFIRQLLGTREEYYRQARFTVDGLNISVDILTKILKEE
jgi:shikimate kinase